MPRQSKPNSRKPSSRNQPRRNPEQPQSQQPEPEENPQEQNQPEQSHLQSPDLQSQSNPLPLELSEQNSLGSVDGDAPVFDGGADVGGDLAGSVSGGDVVSLDVFKRSFVQLLNLGGNFAPSLAVADSELDSANACAEAIYESAQEIPYLRFLIQPGNPWIARCLAIGMFAYPKAKSVAAEMRAKKISKSQTAPGAQVARVAERDPDTGTLQLG